MSYVPHYSTLTRQRMATYNSPPTIRRNCTERSRSKQPNLASTPSVSERKRSSTVKSRQGSSQEEVDLGLVNLPVLALTRVFFYLPLKDRMALSQTCRKLHQSEIYARNHRCALNVRSDLSYVYQDRLQATASCYPPDDVFSSTELFNDALYRSVTGESGSVCSMEKIACIDFGPPENKDRARMGGRMWVTEVSLRLCFHRFSLSSLIELQLHHCHITWDVLKVMAEMFVGLEKLSLSLKGFEFPVQEQRPDLDHQLANSVFNWSSLVARKKKVLQCDAVKQMIMHVYNSFSLLEVFLLYNV